MRKIKWEKHYDPAEDFSEHINQMLANSEDDDESPFPNKITKFFFSPPPKPTLSFNLWYMHTDFYITHQVGEIIKSVPGVEILKPISPYRALIGFGKAFHGPNGEVGHIIKAIEQALCLEQDSKLASPNDDLGDLEKLMHTLKVQNQQFVILVLPNGEYELAYDEDKESPELREKLELFEETAKITGGSVIKSWS